MAVLVAYHLGVKYIAVVENQNIHDDEEIIGPNTLFGFYARYHTKKVNQSAIYFKLGEDYVHRDSGRYLIAKYRPNLPYYTIDVARYKNSPTSQKDTLCLTYVSEANRYVKHCKKIVTINPKPTTNILKKITIKGITKIKNARTYYLSNKNYNCHIWSWGYVHSNGTFEEKENMILVSSAIQIKINHVNQLGKRLIILCKLDDYNQIAKKIEVSLPRIEGPDYVSQRKKSRYVLPYDQFDIVWTSADNKIEILREDGSLTMVEAKSPGIETIIATMTDSEDNVHKVEKTIEILNLDTFHGSEYKQNIIDTIRIPSINVCIPVNRELLRDKRFGNEKSWSDAATAKTIDWKYEWSNDKEEIYLTYKNNNLCRLVIEVEKNDEFHTNNFEFKFPIYMEYLNNKDSAKFVALLQKFFPSCDGKCNMRYDNNSVVNILKSSFSKNDFPKFDKRSGSICGANAMFFFPDMNDKHLILQKTTWTGQEYEVLEYHPESISPDVCAQYKNYILK
jgi:hypothetical protein